MKRNLFQTKLIYKPDNIFSLPVRATGWPFNGNEATRSPSQVAKVLKGGKEWYHFPDVGADFGPPSREVLIYMRPTGSPGTRNRPE